MNNDDYLKSLGSSALKTAGRGAKKTPPPLIKSAWITTFADMSTLLLTFMVLLISVTNMDPRAAIVDPDGLPEKQRAEVRSGSGLLLYSDYGLMAPVIEIIENIDKLPETVMFDQSEIKSAVFQLDPAQTADYEQLWQALGKIDFFKDNRGLVARWDRSLLFAEGQADLFEENLVILDKLALFLSNISLPVSIEGHTNPFSPVEGGHGLESYELSFRRAKTVMEYLASRGIKSRRMRLVGYGGTSPRSAEEQSAWENSRLEIVIYKPPQPSPLGG